MAESGGKWRKVAEFGGIWQKKLAEKCGKVRNVAARHLGGDLFILHTLIFLNSLNDLVVVSIMFCIDDTFNYFS